MKAHIITIGDEILIGQIVDTNSAWISRRLNDAGIRVEERLSVGDQAHEIRRAVENAMSVAQLVIVTGGLGPTKDDITKQVLADIFGGGMREDRETYVAIENMLTRRGIGFNALNRSQAVVPAAADILPNANGTAPGMWFERDNHILVSLPGVPYEMEALMDDVVIPRLKERFNLRQIVHRTMITQGIAESILAEKIAPWEDALPEELRLAYLPSPRGVRLRLSAYDIDGRDEEKIISEHFSALERIIPENFVGYDSVSIESEIARVLTESGKTFSVAESCTGGRIAESFTAMAGASVYFLGGVVAYSNDMKTDVLGVSRDDLAQYGAVSEPVARQMAEGIRRVTGSDYAVSTTGIAGPTGGSGEKPVGTVWIAVSSANRTITKKFMFGNLRAQNIERATSASLGMLRETILTDAQDANKG